jgi:Skp family chaperone for outer membrane proteins
MKIDKLGWIAAAVLAGGVVGAGFQRAPDKTGTVDFEKVFTESNYTKTQMDGLRNMLAQRKDVLEFVAVNRTLTPENANRFRELSLKANTSAAEKAEVERIKNEASQSQADFRNRSTKANPTQEDLAKIEEYNRRMDQTAQLVNRWEGEFMNEMRSEEDKVTLEAINRAKAAVQRVARDQGYTIVFTQQVAPYSANDLTEEALKAANAGR